jgi:hypothetical protein
VKYWFEKYAVIAVGKWFKEQGFEARISVPGNVESLMNSKLGGLDIPEINDDDFNDPQHRYKVYYDTPGTTDLVVRNDDQLWILQAKGVTKRSNAPGDIAQVIGQTVMLMTDFIPSVHYGIILPDKPRFVEVLSQIKPDNPVFTRQDWHLFLVSMEGEVKECSFQEFLSALPKD